MNFLLKERVNTWLGSLLILTVAFWAGSTIWKVANDQDPITAAFASVLTKGYDTDL